MLMTHLVGRHCAWDEGELHPSNGPRRLFTPLPLPFAIGETETQKREVTHLTSHSRSTASSPSSATCVGTQERVPHKLQSKW